MGITFDGPNKLIKTTSGTTSISIKEDIYAAWKLWAIQENNLKYSSAISVIGGDAISESIFLGTTFFLENGWKIKPYEGNHTLTVSGNLYTRDGLSPFVSTDGNYNVMISMTRSNLIDTVATGGSSGGGLTSQQAATLESIKNNTNLIPGLL